MTFQLCIDELLRAGLDDWLHAPEVASVAQFVGGATADDLNRDLSLDLVREVVQRGLMKVGDLRKEGFREWQMTPEAAIARVVREWSALGRRPRLGELFWLEITDEGTMKAKGLLRSPGSR